MSRVPGLIHRETYGQGPSVVLLHGWGMHSGVWRGFASLLADDFRVTLLDLPGHGRSGMIARFDLPGLAEALLAVAPERAHWLGWSLGAAIALYLADRQPERVISLTMMAGSARFARATDWPCGMETELLDRFAADMMGDYHATLMKFLALQTWGLEDARALLKKLRDRVAECEEPDVDALRAGLDILRGADLRPQLARLCLPLFLLMGGRDKLTPAAAGPAMQALRPDAELQVLEAAAHVPFLTHGRHCAELLSEFWQRHD